MLASVADIRIFADQALATEPETFMGIESCWTGGTQCPPGHAGARRRASLATVGEHLEAPPESIR
jgi:enoyl-CoA hydratase/carnithine racemase